MSESDQEPTDEEILGRLPRSRPGRRSPRRDEAADRRAASAERASAASARAARDATERERRRETGRPAETPPEQPGVGDALVGVARAGVAVTRGTVGLGLKAAGGALGAIRGTIERR